MAPGKKQKKSKRKSSKDDSPGLSHIASQLVPSAIFAAVPRTPTNLSQTWPKRSPSPLAQAIGEAGNIGRVVLGDLSKRPPAELPVEHREGDRDDSTAGSVTRDGDSQNDHEEVGYESVNSIGGKRFDKTTKYFSMSREGQPAEESEGAVGESSGDPTQHFYHILDHENGQVVEPPYASVDKTRKRLAARSSVEGEREERESLSDSSDELTDVTSHEEESTVTSESRARRSVNFDDKGQRRHSRKSKKDKRDALDSPNGAQSRSKKSSMRRRTSDSIQEASEDVPPAVPPYLGDTSPQAPERNRRKGQKTGLDEADGPGSPLPPIPGGSTENRLTDEQRRALKVVERLGFEGVSEKLGLSDVSEDEESYMMPVVPKSPVGIHGRTSGNSLRPIPGSSPDNMFTDEQKRAFKEVERLGFDGVSEKLGLGSVSEDELSYTLPEVPKNSVDFHGRTSFEREQFGDTLTESTIPISEAGIEEANLSLSHTFAAQEGSQFQDSLQSPNHQTHQLGFQRQARTANKVSSFVQMLNEQQRQREGESSSQRHTPTEGMRGQYSAHLSSVNGRGTDQRDFDPSLIQRLEEARQANETTFLERQRQLETLVEQQQALYQEQVEQQKIQQQQQQEVVRQQWKLQEQLRALEKMQQEFNENADLSPRGPAVSESDVRLQRELVRQQQDFLQQQQEQLRQSQDQQDQALQQQEKLCNQIRLLEEQQKQLESSVHLLSPAGEDLAEIKQQEQQIVSLLNEQRQQENEYKRLHRLQQQRLEEQSDSFTHERKALEQHQDMLQQKIIDQETRSRQLEQELQNMAKKHADSEAQLTRNKTSVDADSTEMERKIREQEARSRQLEEELQDMARKHADSEAQLRNTRATVDAEAERKIKEQEARSRQLEQELQELARKHADSEAQLRRYKTEGAESADMERKIREQEARSRQIEQQLQDMARKQADSEAQLKRRITSVDAAFTEMERTGRRDILDAAEVNSGRYDASYHGKEGRRRRQDDASVHTDQGRQRKRRNDAESEEFERKDRRGYRDELDRSSGRFEEERRRRQESDISSYTDEGRQRQKKRGDSDLSYGDEVEGKRGREGRERRHELTTSPHPEGESSRRDKRAKSRSSRHREGGEIEVQERGGKGERKSQRRTVEFEPEVRRAEAEVTAVQEVRESEVYHLSKGRIELLESEKAALMELNTSVQEENKALKQLALSLQKGSGISSVVLQKQIKELHQEHKVLRDTVHRLNVELSRYQAKYRPVSFEEVEGFALPQKKEAAPWLVNTKFLAPLFLAYDDRLKEKEHMIKTYDEELNAFKERVMEVVKENQQLHMSLHKASPDSLGPDEWQQVQEQAKLVVEENALLMEQQEIQARKMKELQRVHGQEVSKLSKRISSQESVQRRLETDLEDMRRNHSTLLRKYEAIVADDEKKISLQEHVKIMEECRSVLEDLQSKTRLEAEDSNSRVQAIQKEKNSVAVKLADSEARNAQLERELDAYQKSLKKTERKFMFLQRKLEHIQERELTAQETLSQVLTVAEKTAAERDNYVEFAKTQKVEQEKAVHKILAGTQNIKGLEEKLQEYRRKASDKVAVVTGRLREKEKEINQLREQYETEINNLRALVRQKQRQLELMIGENRNVEKELELVWKTAAADNKRMKNTVRQKGGMFDSDSDPNGHLSSEEGEAT